MLGRITSGAAERLGRSDLPASGALADAAGGLRILIRCFTENRLLTFASAIAFQLFVALIPLALLVLVLLGALSLQEVWREEVATHVRDRFTFTTYAAVDRAVERIMSSYAVFWIVVAVALTIWEVSGSIRAVMGALNRIYRVEESRGLVRRFAVSLLLALGVSAGLLAALLAGALSGRFFDDVVSSVLVDVGGWIVSIVLLWLVIAMLIRFAPARRDEVGLVSAGSLFVIAAWVLASLGYAFYVSSVANFENAFGVASAGFLLTGYLYVSSTIFLLGAQIDELLRERRGTSKARSGR